MRPAKVIGWLTLTFLVLVHPASSAPIAANCRYDTSDRVSSDYNMVMNSYDTHTTPGVHYRVRVDIDLDAGTAKWSSDSGAIYFWKNGVSVQYSSDGSPGKQFVATDGRFVWFGVDHLSTDQRPSWTEKYRLDLESGALADPDGKRWDCEKAVNRFQ